jgi:hypothetical protein
MHNHRYYLYTPTDLPQQRYLGVFLTQTSWSMLTTNMTLKSKRMQGLLIDGIKPENPVNNPFKDEQKIS